MIQARKKRFESLNRILQFLLIINGLMIGIAALSALLFFQMKQSEQWITHTQEVLYIQSDVYSNLQDMNLASRGFAFTGERSLLEPYKAGKSALLNNMDSLRDLTRDNQKEQKYIEVLKQNVTHFEERTQELIATRSAKLVMAQKADMDDIRHSLAEIITEEKRLLIERMQQSNVNYAMGWCTLAAQVITGLALLLACRRTIKTYAIENKEKVDRLETEIEQRKQVEKTLKDTTVRLSRSNSDLQQFAYVASHDLQEPLRAVTGFLTLLTSTKAEKLDEESRGYIKHSVDGAQRMRSLVNDLLTYARVESKAKAFETVKLSAVLDNVKSDLAVAIDESSASVISDELPTVKGDATQLRQLFQNVIGNAIKFRKSTVAPEVQIRCTDENEHWLFAIKDNGRGFDMEHAERIFIIFQRLQGREEASGTGIGLSLCKRIVERHGGKIWVESKPDEGSTFFFTIPKLGRD
jgi:signal transduction histidine kinase